MTADAAGGVWTYALELARGFGERGVRTYLAVMGPEASEAQRAEAREIGALTLFESGLKLEWMAEPWEEVDRAGEWLRMLERELQPEVVHLNGYAHAALPFHAPKLVVAHSCVASWWRAVHGEEAPAEWDEYRSRVKRGLRAADCVAAPSKAMLRAIAAHYGPVRNARAIANGRDCCSAGSLEKEPMVFTAGRLWDRGKNLALLEEAAAKLDWPVYAAGDGCARAPVRGLGALGPREMRGWLARAAIFALPALYEPFGLSVLEAALAGCALVLGDIESLRENWDGAALFASPRDADSFAEQIQRVIRDGRLRERLRSAAMERGRQFPAARMVDAYLNVYNDTCRSR